MATTLPYTKTTGQSGSVTLASGVVQPYSGKALYSFGNGADSYDFTARGGISSDWNLISGGNGSDTIKGSTFSDIIWGDGLGSFSSSDNDSGRFSSDNGSDYLSGGDGNDQIHGGNGADVLQGDRGADVLWGDRGGDTFKYVLVSDSSATVLGAWSSATGDVISDFNASEGDRVDLSAIALSGAGGNMLTWGSGAGAHRVWTSGGFLYADTNGDNVADLAIKVGGITANSFIGVNHDPVGVNDTRTGNEDAVLTGNLRTNDSDSDGDTLSYAVVGTAPAGLTLNTNGTYSFNAGHADYQHLALGAVQVITTTVKVTDGHGGEATETLKITLTGTNDAPVITSAAQSGSVAEDGTLVATGQITATDVDDGATRSFSGNAAGTYGSFAVNAATGAWTYTLDNAGQQNLAEGVSHTETFTVTVTDDKGGTATQAVSVTVTGANDGPTIVAEDTLATGAVKEDVIFTA
ncbi:VCBS domain-containing protein, partial [Novosphingobium bradum]